MQQQRRAAADLLATLDFPTAEQEIWRYSRIDELPQGTFAPVTVPAQGSNQPKTVTELLAALGNRAGLASTIDGHLMTSSIDDAVSAKGVRISGPDVVVAEPVSLADVRDEFSVANSAYAPDPIIIEIPEGVYVEAPIVVVHHIATDNAAVFPRLIVTAGPNSQASIIEVISSDDVVALVVPNSEVHVADGANINYVNIQLLGHRVWQVARQASEVGRDSTLRSTSAAFGGHYARVRTDSRLNGQGGTAYLNAVYFGSDSQMHDFRTLQEHIAPKTTSDLLFKGAVAGTAQSVYSGLIRVRNGAAGTNAFQTNRNLVLTQGAHADSVPNLEIDEQDVRCSHASAVGPVDEEQLYYLESRGVPTEIAERLIVLGFLDDILTNAGVSGVAESLRGYVAAKLDQSNAIGSKS